jgi:hypothetical protein
MEQESTVPTVILDLIAPEIKIKAEDGNEEFEIRILEDGIIMLVRSVYLGEITVTDIFTFKILDESSFRFYSLVTCDNFDRETKRPIIITGRPDIVTGLQNLRGEFTPKIC